MIGVTWTGFEVACLQDAMLLGTDEFGHRIGCSPRSVRLWLSQGPHARISPSSKRLLEEAYTKLDDAGKQRFEKALYQQTRDNNALLDSGVAQVLPARQRSEGLLSELDSLRMAVDQTLTRCSVTPARVELIGERVAERVRTYTTIPPSTALAAIAPDLLEVQAIAAERQPAAIQARLSEASAVLSLLTADALMKLGQIQRANYWYGTARLAADDSPNFELRAGVRAQHAMLPYYYGDLADTVTLARSAQELLPDIACDATALAAAAEARALARLGDDHGAEKAMAKAQTLTDGLDSAPSDEAFRFSSKRLLLYLSGTLTYMGRLARARRVQDEALRLYKSTPAVIIDPALIQLDAAVGYAMDRSAEEGCQLAVTVLDSLPPGHRTRLVIARATDVLEALPARRAELPAAGALRELVTAQSEAQ
ncbi:hypothetical protein [Nocardia iowensis]|uniref:Transcriptional regulator n=1 Tax=Nocardia iowensis TaxID=204891 RepID=A0ABX8RN55_NOCIO|nr:hypothetical protein [Nocardia iowensis]QXN88831.1 hypothetical protein KV110_24980 [Nocardia iowensis]